ncbi:MAG TPA: hypothetical protein ENG40_01250, partial [Thermoprotei archaeon]|nr:hypothetical protein [Thermoprotei archaeon]
ALHICGDNSHLLKSIKMLKVDVVQIDSPVDLKFARKIIEDKCLLGNIDTNLLKRGCKKDIVNIVKKCLEDGGDTLFILSTGCEVVRDTPPQNIIYMIEAGRGLI